MLHRTSTEFPLKGGQPAFYNGIFGYAFERQLDWYMAMKEWMGAVNCTTYPNAIHNETETYFVSFDSISFSKDYCVSIVEKIQLEYLLSAKGVSASRGRRDDGGELASCVAQHKGAFGMAYFSRSALYDLMENAHFVTDKNDYINVLDAGQCYFIPYASVIACASWETIKKNFIADETQMQVYINGAKADTGAQEDDDEPSELAIPSNAAKGSATATATLTAATVVSAKDAKGEFGPLKRKADAAAGRAPVQEYESQRVRGWGREQDDSERLHKEHHVHFATPAAKSYATKSLVAAIAATYKTVISGMARANQSNVITEENYYLLHWLYRIRRASCARGLLIGFLQPDFLWSIYKPMMRSKKWRTDGDIRVAADLWCFDRAAAEERYGHISDWDVSSVTDMSRLFWDKAYFNDDISRWNVSSVTNMNSMFCQASAFNQPVGDWNVSKVTDMSWMFHSAGSFNQPVVDWDVSDVNDMSLMFCFTIAFNQPVGDWDMSNVTSMSGMFCGTHSFNQAIGDWVVYNVTNMSAMFARALAFNQPVGDWDVSNVTSMVGMFQEASAFNQPVGDWDLVKVINMDRMFLQAVVFDQDLTRWDMNSVESTHDMFRHAPAMQRGHVPAAVRDDVYDDSDDEGEELEEGV